MPLSEFELISRYFKRPSKQQYSSVETGIGDDCAVLNVPPEQQLLVSTDTLVEGVHFPEQALARDIAYRCVAVNISDIVAMGGEPQWLSLALTLPRAEDAWVEKFSVGFFEAADDFDVQLIGGDTTRGPLSITITVYGFAPYGSAILRSGAQIGDGIYVSGELGNAAAALHQIKRGKQCYPELINQFYRPQPPVALGVALRNVATACIDVSDGLLADLQHILSVSEVGGELWLDVIPCSLKLKQYCEVHDLDAIELACTGGDDYQLCFTMPSKFENKLLENLFQVDVTIKKVGRIVSGKSLQCLDANNAVKVMGRSGYQHFG